MLHMCRQTCRELAASFDCIYKLNVSRHNRLYVIWRKSQHGAIKTSFLVVILLCLLGLLWAGIAGLQKSSESRKIFEANQLESQKMNELRQREYRQKLAGTLDTMRSEILSNISKIESSKKRLNSYGTLRETDVVVDEHGKMDLAGLVYFRIEDEVKALQSVVSAQILKLEEVGRQNGLDQDPQFQDSLNRLRGSQTSSQGGAVRAAAHEDTEQDLVEAGVAAAVGLRVGDFRAIQARDPHFMALARGMIYRRNQNLQFNKQIGQKLSQSGMQNVMEGQERALANTEADAIFNMRRIARSYGY